ncbi:MAG: hypothetical protein ACRELF_25570, partial [Gemmataceae bacterium]
HYHCGDSDSFWRADALRTSATEETHLRLYWAWSDGSAWTAAEEARLRFARRPVLHKLYVVRERGEINDTQRGEPCEEFLEALLPALRRSLFQPAS